MFGIPQRVLGESVLSSARHYPNKTAIVINEREYTFSNLGAAAENLSIFLLCEDVRKGERVAVYLNNSWEAIVSIYGITLAGAVFVLINPQTKVEKLEYILNDSGSSILITHLNLCGVVSRVTKAPTIRKVLLAGDGPLNTGITGVDTCSFERIMNLSGSSNDLVKVIPTDLAALIYTSGSTGFPKGVMMTHQAMVFSTWSIIEYLRLAEQDRIFLFLPLSFDYGLYQLLMATAVSCTLIVEQTFLHQSLMYKRIESAAPTIFPGVPMVYSMMITSYKKKEVSFSSIKKITSTGATLPKEYISTLQKIFPKALIFKMYGLTECKRVTYLDPDLIEKKPGSVGKAIPGTEVFLLSQQGHKTPLGERGILHIRGPHIMSGYWNKPDLTNEMLKNGIIPGDKILNSNDWFKTDEEGFLYFLGRNDDIIKSRGEKISPTEIENVIYRIPGIKDVAVVGVPDEIIGEAIVAVVTVLNDHCLNEREIQRQCNIKLESFMVPQHIIFFNEMPKNPNGKTDKIEIKRVLLNK